MCFIRLAGDLVNIIGNHSHTVQQGRDLFHVVEYRLLFEYHLSEIFRRVGVARLSLSLDLFPVLEVKCQLLAVNLFILSGDNYQSFRLILYNSSVLGRGLRFRVTGSLNNDFAGAAQNRYTILSRYTKESLLAFDRNEYSV